MFRPLASLKAEAPSQRLRLDACLDRSKKFVRNEALVRVKARQDSDIVDKLRVGRLVPSLNERHSSR